MKIRTMERWKAAIAGPTLALAIISGVTIAFGAPAHAATDTCTWTGAGDGSTFSDGANWSGCDNGGVPETTDTIAFGGTSEYASLTNDLGYAVGGLNVEPTTNAADYVIDTLTVSDGGVLTDNGEGGSNFYTNVLIQNLIGEGGVTFTGAGGRLVVQSANISGVVTISGGYALNGGNLGSPSAVTVEKDGILNFFDTDTTTPLYPITLGGGSGSDAPIIRFFNNVDPYAFANPLSLLDDAVIQLLSFGDGVTVNQTGSITGAGLSLTLDAANSSSDTTLVLNPESNSSATVPGTYNGTGDTEIGMGSESPAESDDVPGAPDTGIALGLTNPVLVFSIGLTAATALVILGRKIARR